MGFRENLTAKDMMVTRLVTLRPEMDVFDAIDILMKNHVAGAPVVDREGRIVGFLSEKDCMQTLVDAAFDSNPTTTVERCMTRDVMTIHEDLDITRIAEYFLHTPLRRLPVVRHGKLVGQISRRDFLRALADWMRPDTAENNKPSFLYLSSVSDRSALRIT